VHLFIKAMTKIITGLSFFTLLFCSCTHSEKIDKQIVYATLNHVIQGDSILARIICNKFDRVTIPDSIQTSFFPNENDFIRMQLEQSKNETIDTGKLFYYWKGKVGLEKSIIDTSCSRGQIYKISYPIFSKDLKTVIIKVTEDCNCSEGGSGFTGVYKFDETRWIMIKRFYGWVG